MIKPVETLESVVKDMENAMRACEDGDPRLAMAYIRSAHNMASLQASNLRRRARDELTRALIAQGVRP